VGISHKKNRRNHGRVATGWFVPGLSQRRVQEDPVAGCWGGLETSEMTIFWGI